MTGHPLLCRSSLHFKNAAQFFNDLCKPKGLFVGAALFAFCLLPFAFLKSQCNPAFLEIPGNGFDEDCDGLDDIYLTLPPFAYALVGQDFEVYFRNLILSKHPNDYVFEAVTALNGTNSGPKWVWTPSAADIGAHDFQVKVKTPGGTTLATASMKIRVTTNAAPTDMAAKKLVLFGHSFFDQGYLPVYLNNLTNQPTNPPITYHGKKASWATPFTKHDGYGGFMWRWFIQDAASPIRYGSKINLRQYFDDVCGGPGQRPDWMVIHFDINDFCGYTALAGNSLQEIDDSITNDWNLNARKIIDSIRVAAPNCKLGICISPPGNARESAFATTYGGNPVLNNRWRWQKIISRIQIKNIERYANREAENIYLIPEQLDIDDFAEYNPPDARHPDPYDNNINTHCGYNEIAKTLYAWVKYVEHLGSAPPPPPSNVWYQDADNDGFGNPAVSLTAATKPVGFVANSTDCNDANAAVNPAAAENCTNGIDDNCNGQVDESTSPTGYCASSSAFPWEDWIASVKIGSVEKTSSKAAYSDHTATVFPLAATNTITLTSGFSYTTFDEYWRVWIDLNRDGDFNDAGEQVAEKLAAKLAIGTTLSATTASFSMTSAICGATRMRVAMTRSAFAAPCAANAFGEVEDFMVTFAGGPPPPPVVKPDLVVQNVSIPASAQAGSTADLSFSINNNGTDATAATITSRAYLSSDNSLSANDLSLGTVSVPMPAIGGSAAANLSVAIPAGQAAGGYFLIIKTDDGGLIDELDEANNTASAAFAVTAAPPVGQPDLIVVSMTAPASVQAGAAASVSFSIKNIGTAAVAPNVAVGLYLSADNSLSANDLPLGTASVAGAAAGASSAGSLNVAVPSGQAAGNYFLIAKADDTGQIAEGDEANNTFSQAIAVAGQPIGQPDLLIASATVPTGLTVGTAATISFSIKNNGSATAAATIATAAYLSADNSLSANDLPLGSMTMPVPAVGASAAGNLSVTVPTGQATGAYFFILKTDDGSTVAEADEANNLFAQAVQVSPVVVPGLPDLQVASANIPASMTAGAGTTVNFSIKNNGTGAATAAFSTSGWLSKDANLSVDDTFLGNAGVSGLVAGASTLGSLSFVLAANQTAGSYFFFLKTDTGGAVAESNEANNTLSQAVAVANSGPVSYCPSAGDFPWHDWISRVKVNSKEYATDKSQYTNNTALAPFTITKNTNNQVRLWTSFSSEVFEEYWRIWVDFNKDGDFLDSGELVFSSKLPKPAAGTLTTSISSAFGISNSAQTGSTRMRVAMKRGPVPPGPCEVLAFGEVEDYTVTVMAQSNGNGSTSRDGLDGEGETPIFTIAPNPTGGRFTVSAPGLVGKKAAVRVVDALGRPVVSVPATELPVGGIDIDLSGGLAGVYLVFVELEGLRAECRRVVVVEE